jgi:protease-4
MKSFLKIVFGSCLGVIIATVVLGLIGSMVAASFMAKAQDGVKINSNSVLKISLDRSIPQKTDNTPEAMYNFSDDAFVGLYETLQSIEAAKTDRNIKGIYLPLSFAGLASAKAESIREAILDFKESGKFVYAYANDYGYGQRAYYVATAADKVFLHPLGMVDFRGYGVMIPYFKDLLDKVGVKMQPFYAGKFKGATEPYRLNKMSDENRLQIKAYLDEMYDDFIQDISEQRNIPPQQLKKVAHDLNGRRADLAMEAKLVDELLYEDEVLEKIKEDLDLSKEDKLHMVSIEDYSSNREKSKNLKSRNKIAIVYAEGEIRNGEETYGMITDEHFVSILRQIRKDEKVKAVVFRVNSPGGDAFVSDKIWREIELIKQADIPVVVSMADVAASGGYYIACGADKIFAEPNTITGSIGVFGIIPNLENLMEKKFGIHMDTVNTSRYANGVVNPYFPIGENEAKIIQESVDHTYEIFLSRVADGRDMTRDEVHEIAQGRVWTGRKAKELGLIDELGDLKAALDEAISLADVDDYRITEYPRIKDPVQKLIEDITGQKMVGWADPDQILAKRFPEEYAIWEKIQYMIESPQPQARLPFFLHGM